MSRIQSTAHLQAPGPSRSHGLPRLKVLSKRPSAARGLSQLRELRELSELGGLSGLGGLKTQQGKASTGSKGEGRTQFSEWRLRADQRVAATVCRRLGNCGAAGRLCRLLLGVGLSMSRPSQHPSRAREASTARFLLLTTPPERRSPRR
ncbi:predicted protein [Histoplasma capsulatum var. duboisii H88]|uniref:Predicted protein n=1 Tax=Ajellomyces capsulatus (strain H88) TaxID=544711 RepID=F0U6R8_AJEC8|nr:predicted protein [Histoplasma capsulatum var. duboisii H88]